MVTEILHEAVSANPVKRGKRWLVTLAVPGKGSSGTYSSELFETYGPTAFPTGTKAYWGHSEPQNRDARDQLGKYEDTFWNAEEQKLQSYLKPYPRWEQVVEEMGSDLELSIYTSGTKDEDGNVLTLEYSRTNSVDAVAFAGLEGSGLAEQVESLAESMGITVNKTSETVSEGKDNKMDEKAIEAINALTAEVSKLVSANATKAEEAAQREVDAEAVETAVTRYDAAVKAIDEADLFPAQVESLRASARKGEDVTAMIESAKAIKAQALEAVQAQETSTPGRILGESAYKSASDLGKVFG